jgi:hypothetical protein
MRRALGIISAALLLATGAASAALADGDPASDVLLGENVFYPYSPPVNAALQHKLNAETQAARAAGFPIKVALIQSPVDLGVIPDLFGKPQKYADFLDQEISFQGKAPLLVVMATGYGVQGLPAKAAAAAPQLTKPAGKSSDALAQAALDAIPKLAAADGKTIKSSSGTAGASTHSQRSSSSGTLILILAIAAVIVALSLAIVTLQRRRAPAEP